MSIEENTRVEDRAIHQAIKRNRLQLQALKRSIRRIKRKKALLALNQEVRRRIADMIEELEKSLRNVKENEMGEGIEKQPESQGTTVKPADLSFSEALRLIKRGYRVARAGWNGKGMFVCLVRADQYIIPTPPYNDFKGDGSYGSPERVSLHPWIGMKTVKDFFVPWIASQTDILAEDWEIFE